ncbi:MAG TPA: M50 family metallopeptidase [Clostridiales bacterium]|nr:M50 family metallopeptidase [Clostridiales bacterium]
MGGYLWIIAFLAVVAPLLTLIHELGHAGAALALVPQHDVTIRIGRDPKISLYKRGRLHILVHPLGGCEGHYGWGAARVEVATSSAIWIALAGPLASLVMALVCAGLKNALGEGPSLARTLVNASMYYNMLQFAATIIPVKYPTWWFGYAGRWSDGLLAWHCLFGEGDKVVLTDTARRDEIVND